MSEDSKPEDAAVPLALGQRVDEVCNQFEIAWRGRTPPRIDDFLAGWNEPERLVLLRELILLDLEYRRRRGEDCRPEDYRDRFPGFDPEWLAAQATSVETVGQAGPGGLSPAEGTRPKACGERASRSLNRPKVLLVPGSTPHQSEELQNLLRRRLLIVACVVALANAVFVTNSLTSLPDLLKDRLFLIPELLLFSVNVFIAGLLWSKKPLSVAGLRLLELALFAAAVAYIVWKDMLAIFFSDWLPEILRYGLTFVTALGMKWVVLLVAYGTLVPNTGRRCAVVVCLLAFLGLALHAWALAAQAVTGSDLWNFLIEDAIWLGFGVGIAIVGSHRLEVLRQEVSEARKLGQYQVRERIGAGGMGEVYLAEHVLLRRPCAIKLIRTERAGDRIHLQRFEREVQTTATLTHPNTVQVFDYGHTQDGTFYYVMEYLPGLTLEQLVEHYGPLPSARVLHFLGQVCGALREAHGRGLIHRDIKPSNIVICERGGLHDVAKLLDFGLVRVPGSGFGADSLTQEGAIAGTPAYMSPEQAAGTGDLDARSDIYSLGAVAYFLLTGHPPFAGRSAVQVLAAHMYEPVAALTQYQPDVPADLEEIVLRCLAKEPAARFPDVQALEKALAGCRTFRQWGAEDAANWWRCRSASEPGQDGLGEVSLCAL